MASNADKASRLFKYLAERQRSVKEVVFQTSEYLTKGGAILRLGRLVSSNASNGWVTFSESSHDDAVVSFHQPVQIDFPQVSGELAPWISRDRNDPYNRPTALEVSSFGDEVTDSALEWRKDRDVEEWLERWDKWAQSARHHNLYQKALKLHTRAAQKIDEFRLVLGLGSLGWRIDDNRVINKHLYNIALHSELDTASGTVTFRLEDSHLVPDVAALLVEHIVGTTFLQEIEQELAGFDGELLTESSFTQLGRVTAKALRSSAAYSPNRINQSPTKTPMLCWDPAIILRPRNDSVLSTAFEQIAHEISANGKAPAGINELFDLIEPDSANQHSVDQRIEIAGAPKFNFDAVEQRPLSLRPERRSTHSPVASKNGAVFSYSETPVSKPAPKPAENVPPWRHKSDRTHPAPQVSVPKLAKRRSHSLTADYVEFADSTVPVTEATGLQIQTGLLAILRTETPMTGGLLRTRYVKSSGIQFVNRSLASPLNRAIYQMLVTGEIRELNNGRNNGYTDRTLYLPKTPPVVLRDRGSRLLGEIPVEEVRGLMREVFKKTGIDDRTELMQRTLNEFGFVNLTELAVRILDEPYSQIMAENQS